MFTWGSPGDPDDEAPVITVELRELPERPHRDAVPPRSASTAQPGDENVYDGWDSAFDMLAEQLAGGRG